MMWLEKVYLQPCTGFSNSTVVFRASTVRKNSIKRIMTQSLNSPAELCPLLSVRANQGWSLSDCRSEEWVQSTRRVLCSGSLLQYRSPWSGARFLFSRCLTCPLWAIPLCMWWIKWWLETHYLSWNGRSICADWPSHEFLFGGEQPSLLRIFVFYTVSRSLYPIHAMPSHFSSADTDTNKNFSVSPSFFFAESNRPRYIHQNWTAITHRPESSICTGSSLSHFNAQTTTQRALHRLYGDWFVACCDWYRILDPHASPRPFSNLAL